MEKNYRKKPVVIQAIPFFDDVETILALSEYIGKTITVDYSNPNAPKFKLSTLEGVMEASLGDYIIRGVDGEFYPCKPDIFKKTYEEVID